MSVYLMRDLPTGHYKIGRSNNPQFREKTLLSQAPEIYLLSYWDCDDDRERYLHGMFKDYRKRGEWFDLPDAQFRRLYWLMRMHPRTDEFLRPEDRHRVLEHEWRFSALIGGQSRYPHCKYPDEFEHPAVRISEMEWHVDGMYINYQSGA